MRPEDFSADSPGRVQKVLGSGFSYWAFIPDPLPPKLDYVDSLVVALGEANRAMGEFSGLLAGSPGAKLLIRPLLRKEAVSSSQIEGTTSEITDLYLFEASDESSGLPEDVREVSNYLKALEYGLDRIKSLPISTRLFRELHAILMKDVRGGHAYPGELRTTQNWIGKPGCTLNEADFVPPPPEELNRCLSDLEVFINSESKIPPLVKLALVHYQFEAIHPFVDGNGRVGRLLIALLKTSWGMLDQPGLYLSGYFEANRLEYYSRLRSVSFDGEWNAWVLFFTEAVLEQSNFGKRKLREMMNLRNDWIQRVRSLSSSLPMALIDHLFENPILTIPQASEKLGVTYVSARRAIESLCKNGILTPQDGSKYAKKFIASELLEMIK
ncbi:Fic family protein [Mesotoga sp.]|uniref:Fic family protein n=1 Tax=Mesotoga sp. TaxID=2053577 RepID=UPI00345E542D